MQRIQPCMFAEKQRDVIWMLEYADTADILQLVIKVFHYDVKTGEHYIDQHYWLIWVHH